MVCQTILNAQGKAMKPIDVVKAYLNAWNHHDAQAIVALFADGGTYSDPTTAGRISGQALGLMAEELWKAFPDLAFELTSMVESASGLVAVEWLMKGTNHGSLGGLPPTGKVIALPGADFVQVEAGKIRSITGYFDKHGVAEQVGLQVVAQPTTVGPFSFGLSTAVQSGKKTRPGAFSITQIIDKHAEDGPETSRLAREVLKEMTQLEGFIGVLTAKIGHRAVTITAWEHADNPRQLLKTRAHGEAMTKFFCGFGRDAYTSVWTPERVSGLLVN